MANVTGDVRLHFGALQFEPGVAVHDGALKLVLSPGKAVLTEISGRAASGALSGAMQLAKSPAGVTLDGALQIAGASLKEFSAAGQGKTGLDVKAAAQAQSPAALITALSGTGTLTFDAARLPAPGPAAGADAVAAVLSGKIPNQPEELALALKTSLATANANLGTRTVPLQIAGGAVKVDPITIETADGSVTSVTTVELASLAIDSAWKLAAVVPPLPPLGDQLPGWIAPPVKGPLPPALIVYTGHLNDVPALAVNVDVAGMQRELAVRQMERNVEELERLRRQDEYRARLEQERRLAIEAERAAAKAAGSRQTPAVVLPPVLPVSAGTAAPLAGAPLPAGAAQAATLSTTIITIEPIPPGQLPPSAGDAAGAPIVPAGERPATAARPLPARATAPQPRPATPRRTTSDEVMRSLGGFP